MKFMNTENKNIFFFKKIKIHISYHKSALYLLLIKLGYYY